VQAFVVRGHESEEARMSRAHCFCGVVLVIAL
jgi:hypothetical protein